MEIVREIVGGEPYEYVPLGAHIVQAPGVCGGRPTFKYTRVEVSGILNRLGCGEPIEKIVASFNGAITREAVQEAVDIATRHFLDSLPEPTAA